MSTLDQHAATVAQLTRNAVVTLSLAVQGEYYPHLGQTYTGLGKWTWLAMLGVHNNLRKAGLIQESEKGLLLTALGMRIAQAVNDDYSKALSMCRASTRS
jgi:hypothetical protein